MKKIQGYVVWFIATLFVVYAFCLNTASAVFSDAIKTTLHASNFTASLATGAFILGFACMQIPAGYLLDKFNVRWVVSIGICLLAVGNLIISYSDNLILFSLSNFLQGVGASFAFVAAAVLIAQWFPPSSFPIWFGLTQTVSCILSGVIHYYFAIALATYTWGEIYRVISIFGFSLFASSLLMIKSPDDYQRGEALSLIASLRIVLTNKQLLLCSLAAATSFGVLLAYAGLWYDKVQDYYLVADIQSVIISGIIFSGIGIGTPLLAWLSNRLHSRVMIIHVALCLGAMALLMSIYLPHFEEQSLLITQILAFLTGFFLSGSMLYYTIVNEVFTNATRGVAMSVLNTAVFLFNTLMLFIPYLFVTTASKDFFTYLWMLPFFILLSLLVLYFIKDSNALKFSDGHILGERAYKQE